MKWSGGSSALWFPDRRHAWILVAALASGLVATASPALAQRLAVLPVENQGDVPDAGAWVMPRVEGEVAARGWEVISGEPVERWLASLRIRRMDSLSGGVREALLGEMDAQGYVATTIFSFHLGDVPVVTIGIRVVDRSGVDTFNEVIGLSTEDTRGPLDPWPGDAIEPLVDEVIARLFRTFPGAGELARRGKLTASPVRLHEPFTFVSADLEQLGAPHRVAILPFRSFADDRASARIAAQLTARWLERAPGFEPVEPADLRDALIAENVRNAAMIWPETMLALGERLGSTLFLRGTVYRWQREADAGSEIRTPEVEVNLMLIDAATSRIVWSAQHARRGDQYSGFLRLGAITNVVALADRVIGEMIAAQVAARPISVPPPRAANAPINGALKAQIHGPLEKGTEDP